MAGCAVQPRADGAHGVFNVIPQKRRVPVRDGRRMLRQRRLRRRRNLPRLCHMQVQDGVDRRGLQLQDVPRGVVHRRASQGSRGRTRRDDVLPRVRGREAPRRRVRPRVVRSAREVSGGRLGVRHGRVRRRPVLRRRRARRELREAVRRGEPGVAQEAERDVRPRHGPRRERVFGRESLPRDDGGGGCRARSRRGGFRVLRVRRVRGCRAGERDEGGVHGGKRPGV